MASKTKVHIPSLLLSLLFAAVTIPSMAAAPGDIVYEREDKSQIETFPPSTFPHWKHRIHYRCDTCHDSLFEMKRGGTPVTMDMMKKGEVCGVCHNAKLAFPASFENCARCHVAPEE